MQSTVATAGTSRYNTRSAKREAAGASRRAALGIPEILEHILSYLSPKQIFRVQRVSQTWRNGIAGSSTLQEKVFLRLPQKPEHLHWNSLNEVFTSFTPVRINPFLRIDRGMRRSPLLETAFNAVPSDITLGYTFNAESSILDTFIPDPPCYVAWITANFYPAPPQSRTRYCLICKYMIESKTPLTIRHAIETPELSTTVDGHFFTRDMRSHEAGKKMFGEVVRRMENAFNCQFVMDPSECVIRLGCRKGGPFPLTPTEAEWKAVRPRVEM